LLEAGATPVSAYDSTMTPLSDFRADRRRYPPAAWLFERSIWSVAIYRLQQAIAAFKARTGRIVPLRMLITGTQAILAMTAQVMTGNELPPEAQIGPGLRIHHSGNVIINPRVRIGRDCTVRHGVSIGNLVPQGPAPVLGDRVELGAYAQLFGAITIGDDAKVGAMSVVLRDVPTGATAVGIPARVINAELTAPS
jgi:serine O-acetyltransferase